MKIFYRVCNEVTKQGLWYDYTGSFTGLIHNKFDFCKNKDLLMDYDPELVGYLSATDNLEHLYQWFTREDILGLQEHDYFIHTFETDDYKFYERFQHLVINQAKSKPTSKIILL